MPERKPPGLPLDTDDAAERALWDALGRHEPDEPSAQLRRGFYRKLEAASRPSPLRQLGDWLGFRGNAGWMTAAACLLLGLGTGFLVEGEAPADDRLAALEENVTLLNRQLILDRLDNRAPGKRLRGVIDAAYFVGEDSEITRALLERATEDRVPSVRAAAIDALGARLNAPAVGEPLMGLLERAESPIVQLALVDLVLRYGNDAQRDQLLALARGERLYPDLNRYVSDAFPRDSA